MKVITDSATFDLGATEVTPTIGITDYSRRVTDDFGVTTIVKRGYSRTLSVRMAVPFDQVDTLQRRLADLRATSALWVADESLDWLSARGFYRDFSIDVAMPPLSFCTLTVEGLAANEVVADTGVDPAPDGRTSTLRLLQPIEITDARLTSSSVAENDYPAWSAAMSYAVGARVIRAHRIWESLVAANVGHEPVAGSGFWLDTGPTNRWAMFDQALGTSTEATGSIAVTLNAGTVQAVALLDVVGASVRVQAGSYDRTQTVGQGAVTFLDMPTTTGAVQVTITGSGTVSVGTLLIGKLVSLGITEASPTAGITDFSRKEVDDFGEVTIVERAWVKRMAARALIRTSAVDMVANRIADVRATPSLWIGDDGRDSLTVYGLFKDFSIEVGENVSTLSLSVEGLSAAAKLDPVDPDIDVSWPDIKDDDPAHPKPEDGATNSRDPDSPLGPDGKTVGDVLLEVNGKIDRILNPPTMPGVPVLTSRLKVAPDQTQIVILRAAWTAATSPDLGGYIVRIQENGSDWVEYPVGKGETRWEGVANAYTVYRCQVCSIDTQGNRSSFTLPIQEITTSRDTTPPAVPTGLSASVSLTSIFLEAVAPADADLDAIEIWENAVNSSGTAARLTTVKARPGGTVAYARGGIGTGVTRYYWMKAVDTSGNVSGFSAGVSATTPRAVSDDIADGIISNQKLMNGLAAVETVTALPSTGNFRGRTVMLQSDGKLYRWNSTATTGTANWSAKVDTTDLNGQITNLQIETIDAVKVTGQLTNAQIAAVDAAKLTGQIIATQISDNAITTPKIAAGAVTTNELAAGSVIADKIAAAAVTTAKVAAGAITALLLAANAVTADKIAANAVTTDKLLANSVTTAKIAAGAVTANEIAAATITGDKIVAGTISGSLIAANAITARNLAIGDFTNKVINDWSGVTFDGWRTNGPLVDVVEDNRAPTVAAGFSGGVLRAQGGEDRWVTSVLIPVNAGDVHYQSMWVYRNTSGGVNDTTVYMQSRYTIKAEDGSTSYTYFTLSLSSGTNNWQFMSRTTTAPANAIYLEFFIRTAVGGGSTPATNWFARPVLRQMMKGELIVDGTILAQHLATNSVTAAKIAAGAVTADSIATNAVTTAKINAGAVTANEIAANAVTTAKIAANAVTANEIAANAVTTQALAANAVTADKIAANTITASKLIVADLSNLVINNWTGGDTDGWGGSTTLNIFNGWGDTNFINAGIPGYGIRQPGDGGWVSSNGSTCSTGEKFYAEIYVYRNAALAASQTLLQLRWLIANSDGSTSVAYSSVRGTTTTGSFIKLAGIVEAPDKAVNVSMWIRPTTSNISSSAYVAMGRPVLRRASSAELIVNGSITADKIAANTITATSGIIANAAITSAHIENLTVGTDKIAYFAAQKPYFAALASDQALISTVETPILSLAITKAISDSVVDIEANLRFYSTDDIRATAFLYDGSTQLDFINIYVNGAGKLLHLPVSLSFVDNRTGTGSRSYTIKVVRDGGASNVTVRAKSNLNIVEIKR